MPEPKQKPGRSTQVVGTPADFLCAVKARLGIDAFTIDLAADETNAKAPKWIDEATDSLTVDWGSAIGSGYAWLNPPFANIGKWAAKCAETAAWTDAQIAMLVPASVGSDWYRDYVDRAHARALFLNGRLTFEGHTDPYPKDLMLVLYGLGCQGNDVWSWKKRIGASA